MCGILGVLNPSPSDRARAKAALDLIAHRGPDGEGRYDAPDIHLGHRRLAIIDLSAAADQPMTDPATGATLIFNGEIYNYREVRDELKALGVAFLTASDTEVLLRAWLQWGAAMFPRLNGMWAFALWDPRDSSLVLARDRFGVKPLHYALVDGRLLFASEPKAILALEPSLAEPNAEELRDFFAISRMHAGDRGFHKAIHNLPAATFARVNPAAPRVRPEIYWSYPEADPSARSDEDPDAFAALFESAVWLRMRSDVPVGLTLSGGLDSSAVLAAAGGRLQCFTSIYTAALRGEEAWAAKAAAIAEAPLTAVEAHLDDWSDALGQAIDHMESPSYSPAILPLWMIMRTARRSGVPVLLEGQGADEILGGYASYAPGAIFEAVRRGENPLAMTRRMAQTFTWKWLSLWLLRAALPGPFSVWRRARGGQSLLQPGLKASQPEQRSHELFAQLKEDHAGWVLPALLHYGDAISMAHGVESRLPFMDYRLVEWVFRRRPNLFENGETKSPVRRFLRAHGYGIIADRRDKQGYPTPLSHWLRAAGGARFEEALLDRAAPIWEYVRPEAARSAFTRGLNGDAGALFQVFKVMTAHIWLEQLKRRRTFRAAEDFSEPVMAAARLSRA